MRVKVDEDLPSAAVDMLRAAGHDALSVRDQPWLGLQTDVGTNWPKLKGVWKC
ncbi:MAG TPA: hypothetical protein VFJ58_28960 [Armatimonadota bacterium]|nr:hypothetical protein [Armatimonadota bacterium]